MKKEKRDRMELEIQGCSTFAGEGPHVLLVHRQFIKVSEGILHNSYYCCHDSEFRDTAPLTWRVDRISKNNCC